MIRLSTVLSALALLAAPWPGNPGMQGPMSLPWIAPDTAAFHYTVDGVNVIQRVNAANDVVAVRVYLLGGARQLSPTTQGIESLYLEASEYGTAAYPAGAIRAKWAETGSVLVREAEADWTVFGFLGIRQEFDSAWNIVADRLAHPSLAPAAVTRARDRLISNIRRRKDTPDGVVSLLADSIAFAGHPYGLQVEGTEDALRALDSTRLVRYGKEQLVQSRLLVVVVGNVSRAQVEQAVARTLARLPRGTYQWTLPPPVGSHAGDVTLVPRDVSTNYIIGIFDGPPPGSPEYPPFRIAAGLLSGAIGAVVRQQEGLSYVALAGVRERGLVNGQLYVTTTRPDTVLAMMKLQLKSLRNMPVGVWRIPDFTEGFLLDVLHNSATNSSQADLLARAQLFRGDFREAANAARDYRSVTSARVRDVAQRFFKDVRFVYLGDTTRVKRESFDKFDKF